MKRCALFSSKLARVFNMDKELTLSLSHLQCRCTRAPVCERPHQGPAESHRPRSGRQAAAHGGVQLSPHPANQSAVSASETPTPIQLPLGSRPCLETREPFTKVPFTEPLESLTTAHRAPLQARVRESSVLPDPS